MTNCAVGAVELISPQWRERGQNNNLEIDVRPAEMNNNAGKR